MANIIIGTAGHIDHGKTTLIRALTGIETDRLKEEKKRGITIELGFAYFDLPSGRRAGIVDVPGHERFIKNMLAGVGGIDLVLFVIAADEGVMPQTVEHLDILNLLGVEKGIIVLTKADLVDEEMLELVREEAMEQIEGTALEGARIIEVSAVSGLNLDQLAEAIDEETSEIEGRNTSAPARMNIDRVFTMKGHGTVVTGTLLEGRLGVDEQVEIYPERRAVKVRGLQVHGQAQDAALAGQRTAVNLSGVKVEEVHRGAVIAKPGSLALTSMIDIRLKLLAHSRWTLKHGQRIRFYHGTREMIGRLILFEQDQISPGDEVYAQLRFSEPLACKYGDRFVIRFYSPMETIGGGTIIDSNANKHRRFDHQVIEEMMLKEKGAVDELIETYVRTEPEWLVSFEQIGKAIGEGEKELLEEIDKLIENQILYELTPRLYCHRDRFEEKAGQVVGQLETYHKRNALESGMSKEEVKNRIFGKIKKNVYEAVLARLADQSLISEQSGILSLAGFEVSLTEGQKKRKEKLLLIFKEGAYKPPSLKALQGELSKEDQKLIGLLIQEGQLVRINSEILYEKDFYLSAKRDIIKYIEKEGKVSVKDLKDLIDISRKYSVPLLEHFDEVKVTKRVDDFRVLY